MKVRPGPDPKGYIVSSTVVRKEGARAGVIEKFGLIAAIAITLVIGLWLIFVIY